MAKIKYVTDDYIEKVEHYLYNNLRIPYDEDVSETVYYFNKAVAEKILKEGEEYIQLEDELEHVIITSLGRLINTRKIRQYSVRFSPHSIHAFVSRNKIDIPQKFEEQGWDYDFKTIKHNYTKYNWRHTSYEKYLY